MVVGTQRTLLLQIIGLVAFFNLFAASRCIKFIEKRKCIERGLGDFISKPPKGNANRQKFARRLKREESAMIPPKNHPKWASLVKGEIKTQFSVFAGNMMLSQCHRKYSRDSSPESLRACIDEAHVFFTKYESIYQNELRAIF